MNCKTFMRKLPEFMENSIMYDMSEAMEKHMNECNSCKQRFEEEKAIELAFSMALDTDEISFNSCRSDIMKNIDKNKYSKSPISKVKYGIKKFQIQIISTAAVLLMTVLITPHIANKYTSSSSSESGMLVSNNNDDKMLIANNDQNPTSVGMVNNSSAGNIGSQESMIMDDELEIDKKEMKKLLESNKIYVPKFTRVDLEVNENLEFATDWVESPDKALKVAIEGRGDNGTEQGIGKLVFINKSTSQMWKLSLANNETKQFTPMKVSWYDNENLMVIFGYGQGRETLGGDVILLNAFTGKAVNIYWEYSLDSKKQVVEAIRDNDKINLRVILYDDKIINYKEEFRSIVFNELYNDKIDYSSSVQNEASKSAGNNYVDNNDIFIKSLEQLKKSINEKKYESMSSMFSQDLLKEEAYLNLLQVQSMYLVRVINVSNSAGEDSTSMYYVETIMDMKEESNLYKTGANFLSICVQKNEKGNLIITDIERLPQN